MPELPEVQTTVNGLNRKVRGLVIADVWTDYHSPSRMNRDNIKDPVFFARFKKGVVGATIVNATRRGKNILIHISKGSRDATILIHMKMTGHMMYGRYDFDAKKAARRERDPWFPAEDGPLKDSFNRFIHLVFTLSDVAKGIRGKSAKENRTRQLVLSDMRKFAKVTLIEKDIKDTAAGDQYLEQSLHLKAIGPEPLDPSFTFEIMRERLMKRPKGKIKTVLMTPEIVAGIGNIYSDEILWRAGVHPEERVEDVPPAKLKLIFDAIKTTLNKGIDFGGDSMSDYRNIDGERGKFQEQHNAYRKTGTKCKKPGCSGVIVRKIVGARSAHFCSVHQKLVGPKSPKKRFAKKRSV